MRNNFLLFFFVCLLSMPAHASNLPSSNVCQIEAEVLDVSKRWVDYADPNDGMYVILKFKIDKTGELIRKYADERDCSDVYKVGAKYTIGEYERKLLGNIQTLEEGQRIRAALVAYRKGGAIRPSYTFQAIEEDAPLVKVLTE